MAAKDGMFQYADGVDKLLMFLGTLGSIGDGLQYPLTMFVLSKVINEYGNPNSILSNDTVDKYALRLLYVAIVVGLSAFVEGICWTRTAERQTSRIRTEYLKSALRQEVGFFDNQEAGSSTTFQVVSTISADANTIQVAICEKIPDCLAFVSTFFFCLVVSFILSWKLTLASLPFTLLFIVPGLVFGKLMMDVIMKMIESYGIAGGIAEQAISSIRTVYSYVAENQTLDKFSRALQKTLELGVKQGFAKGLMMGCMGSIYVGWAFQAWLGTYLVTEKGEKGGSVFVAGINVIMGGLSVLGALPNLTGITEATIAATRILEMIDRVPSIDTEDRKGKALLYVRGEIEFKGIYFSYPSRPDTPVLQGLNLIIPAISQEPVLFATIKQNILFGKEGASMEDVIDAAKVANAHDFIVKLPEGYETHVGQFGFQMSGGQKQRIAIAKALIRNPKILLLDGATSALDAQAERIVQEAMDKASVGRTTIIIAHRLSTIRNANVIVVLQAGRVIESGSHDELMRMNGGEGGEYNRMVELQKMALQNQASDDSNYQTEGRNHHRMNVAQSPLNYRSSAASTPALNPFSPALSVGTPYSYTIQYDPDDDSVDENSKQLAYPVPSQWRLLKMNAPEWGRALIGSMAAIGSGAVQPINAYCVDLLISIYFRTDKSEIKSKSRTLSFVFLGIAALNFTSSLLQHYTFAVMGEKLTKRVREKFLQKMMTFEISWFDEEENTSAAICTRLATEANMVRSLVGDRMSLLVQAVFGSIFAYAVALKLTWRLSLVMIAVQPLVVGSFYSRSMLMKRMAVKAQKAQKEGSQLASEAVVNHRTITAFSSQKRMLGLFKDTLKGPKEESVRHSWLSDRKSEIDSYNTWGREIKKAIKGRIELKNVFFAYPTRPDQLIFKGLNLRIEAGRTVALVGQSGSGKSTIIGLIERFYDPMNGSVSIDGQDIKTYNLRMLRAHIALVSQGPTLFAGTIRENIAYGKENAKESEIRKAAKLANAHEFISGMKDGYDTNCGERGVQLSGGQKQRIALARAILKNPSILLLDEATSALDSVSESLVQEALEKMMVNRTCVIVAHRLSTIQKFDAIAVIKNGKVVEQGSHNELVSLGHGGAYYSLIKLQGGNSPYR
ncbi:hypothetical protein CRYUN_Cryun38cG0060800 [Craigia yunnanensis]